MMNNKNIVSIVILNRNGVKYLRNCIDSITQYTNIPYELIVVDNGSTDGSLEYLKRIDGIKLIANSINEGAPYARNKGVSLASGRYLVFLDNDVIVTEDWLSRFIKYASRDSSVGIWGPMSNYVSGVQFVPNVAYRNYDELQLFSKKWARLNADKMIYCNRLILFCMFVKREVVEKIGGFDPLFGNWGWDDDDYCVRAQIAGFKLGVACEIFIHHEGSKTPNVDRSKLLIKNGKLFIRKWDVKEWNMNSAIKYPVEKIISRHFDPSECVIDIPKREEFENSIYSKKHDGFKFTSYWNAFCSEIVNDRSIKMIPYNEEIVRAIIKRDVKSLANLVLVLNTNTDYKQYVFLFNAVICLLSNDLNQAILWLEKSLQCKETKIALYLIFYLSLFLGDHNSASRIKNYLALKIF